MKLIIEIPEEAYKQIIDFGFLESTHGKMCYKAIKNGTPIHENATMLSVTEWADKCRECGSMQGRKLEQIRAEIEDKRNVAGHFDTKTARAQVLALSWVLDLIDKYKKGGMSPEVKEHYEQLAEHYNKKARLKSE